MERETEMPYADKALQRQAQRASMRRLRARQRETVVKPSAPTFDDLAMAGRILGRGKAGWETEAEYH
jgi:hypothetical protein